MAAHSEFAQEVRRARKDQKLTLADLAELTGISVPYLSELERGNKQPPLGEQLTKLARALRIDLDKLAAYAVSARRSVEIDIQGASPAKVELASLLARRVEEGGLSDEEAKAIIERIDGRRRGGV